jgi:hypothetical protein
MKISKYLLILFFICCGCTSSLLKAPFAGPTIQYNVYVSKKFPPSVDKIIRNSFNEWQNKLQFLIQFDYKDGYIDCLQTTHAICIEPATPAILKNRAGLTGHSDLLQHALILISTDTYTSDMLVSIVSKHEIGHSIGLQHTEKHNTIMYCSGDFVSQTITNYDINSYLKKRNLVK